MEGAWMGGALGQRSALRVSMVLANATVLSHSVLASVPRALITTEISLL